MLRRYLRVRNSIAPLLLGCSEPCSSRGASSSKAKKTERDRRPSWHRTALLALGLFVSAASGCAVQSQPPERTQEATHRVQEIRYVMGTLLDITLYAATEKDGRAQLNEAFLVAEKLDQTLSTYKPESALTHFNENQSTSPVGVDPELYRMIAEAQKLSHETAGAFDISIRPLVTMWEHAAARGKAPTAEDVKRASLLIGPHALRILPGNLVQKRSPVVQIESGGIGKGIAVDAIIEKLRALGVTRAFVDFGRSSIAAIGAPPQLDGWPVTLELREGVPDGALSLRNETLTVSRAKGTPFIVAGVSYAHIFDPSTGYPVRTLRGAAIRSTSATAGEAYVKYLVIRGAPPKRVVRGWHGARWIVRSEDTLQQAPNF